MVIAGGGVAGLEAMLALRELAGDAVNLTLVAPEPEFVYRPMTMQEPFGFSRARRYPLDEIVTELGAELLRTLHRGVPTAAPDGSIPVDEDSQVRGVPHVRAAGDATDFPVKLGGIAAQQADTAAAEIGRLAGAQVAPQAFHPCGRSGPPGL